MSEWKLVPVEPTEEMLASVYSGESAAIRLGYEAIYRGMVAAVPPTPNAKPVATLHDDGYFTFKSADERTRYRAQFAGWRMDVFAAPPAPPADAKALLRQALDALNLACAICDLIPTRAHKLQDDDVMRDLGLMVNAVEGSHGYRTIHNARDALRAAILAALGEQA